MIPARILKGLLEIARAIGRWAIEKLAYRTAQWLIHYMEGRVEVFLERRRRAMRRGNDSRVEWLDGRIKRWGAAIRWLRSHVQSLAKASVRAYCQVTNAALREIPRVAAGERYRRAA